MSESIIIEFQTQKKWCHCCNQKIPNPKTSNVRKFEFIKKQVMEDEDWVSIDEDDYNQVIEEYVYETIGFFATSSDEQVVIKEDELGKFKGFVLNQLKD